jgi:hypothetical protein
MIADHGSIQNEVSHCCMLRHLHRENERQERKTANKGF